MKIEGQGGFIELTTDGNREAIMLVEDDKHGMAIVRLNSAHLSALAALAKAARRELDARAVDP